MSIKTQILNYKSELPSTVKLVAVSKFKSNEAILEAYNAGQRAFAESRPQELRDKAAALPKDIEWHFIGNLQSNKIKYVAPVAKLVHSVSNEKLLLELANYCTLNNLTLDILIEVSIATDDSKQGFIKSELIELFEKIESDNLFAEKIKHLNIRGLMGMASFTDDQEQIKAEFTTISQLFRDIKSNNYKFLTNFDQLSIGMSGDYKIAIECGATMVRIGTSIFGDRI
ncbi:MAG: YggS family pyridoxal phosphate-dependent enzyme [Bacteroidales bacterium]|nr:YggS family pyridoxal phosphate-dependent enzyme [Bacteroidales bacterium]